MSDEDSRVAAAREVLTDGYKMGLHARAIIEGLIAYAEERLRVNVGLVAENAELRRQVRDISEGREVES